MRFTQAVKDGQALEALKGAVAAAKANYDAAYGSPVATEDARDAATAKYVAAQYDYDRFISQFPSNLGL